MTGSIFRTLQNQALAAPFWADLLYENVSNSIFSMIISERSYRIIQRLQSIGSIRSMLVPIMQMFSTT